MSKIEFNQVGNSEIEVSIPRDTPIEMVNELVKSFVSKGLVENLAKSTLGVRYFYRPQDSVNEAADKLIKSLEGLTKARDYDESLPYWNPKNQFAQQRKNKEADIASRRALQGIKQPTNTSTAPEPHVVPAPSSPKMYDTTPGSLSTAGGTGRRYGTIGGEGVGVAKKEHPEGCKCDDCKKSKKEVKKSWGQHLPFPSAEEELMKLAKATAQSGEVAAVNQLANLMRNKQMLGAEVHPAIRHMFAAPRPQPTNEELFGHLVVTDEMAKSNQDAWENTFNDWMAEASKPISQRFSSPEEEAAYWASIKVSDRDDGGSGY